MRSYAHRTVGAVALALLASCSLPSDPSTPPLGRGVSLDVAENGDSLPAILANEIARIAARAVPEAAIYDSLKVIWDAADDAEFVGYEGQLICDPLQYTATAKIIGPAGGDIDFGPHKLSIPAGALSTPTVITAEAPTSLVPLARFSPHGTVFSSGVPVRLDLSYKHCHTLPGQQHRLGYLGDNGTIVEWPPAEDDVALGVVRGWIAHFSAYIVAF